MSEYELIVNYEKCTGCRLCETVCAMGHGSGPNPENSRIRIVQIQSGGSITTIPARCMQCKEPPCKTVCPSNAISTDAKTGAMMIDEQRCIGCSICVLTCPFGAIAIHRTRCRAIVCDLCGGDPLCARFCAFDALKYVRSDDVSIRLKREKADKIINALKPTSEGPE